MEWILLIAISIANADSVTTTTVGPYKTPEHCQEAAHIVKQEFSKLKGTNLKNYGMKGESVITVCLLRRTT